MPTNPSLPLCVEASLIEYTNQWVREHPDIFLRLYALADAGQDRGMWQRLARHSVASRALLASAADDLSPHLFDLGSATERSAELSAVLSQRHAPAAYTLICSSLPLLELHAHLRQFVDVKLPGDYEMLLAFWDSAILGTLVGQADDDTLHVAGPVLLPQQLQALLRPIAAWWYCDRKDNWHRIEQPNQDALDPVTQALVLTQAQEDALVEASVPDQVLYHLEQNRPTLFDQQLPHFKRYRFVREVLKAARKLGLEGMRDLTSFVALCLIYRQRIETDPQILQLLDQVQQKTITLSEALELMPE